MRSRGLAWIALVGCLVALGAAAAPTYTVAFMPPPTRDEPFISYHSWFYPLMLVYGDPFPLLASAVVTTMTIVALLGAAGRMSPKPVVVLASIALVVIGADYLVVGSWLQYGSAVIHGLALLVPGGVLVALAASLLSVRGARGASA